MIQENAKESWKEIDDLQHVSDQQDGLLGYFDAKLEEFHDWVVHLRERREEELKEKDQQEHKYLKELEVNIDQNWNWSSWQKTWFQYERRRSLIFWISWWCIALLGYFLFQSLEYVYLIVTWIILSMAAESSISKLSEFIPRWVSIILVYIFLILFILSWILLVIPFLVQQAAEVVNMFINIALVWRDIIQTEWLSSLVNQLVLPTWIKNSLALFLETTNLQESIQQKLIENISWIVSMGTTYIKNAWDFAVGTLWTVFSWIFQIAIVFMVWIFSSIEKTWLEKFISWLSSQPKRMFRTVEKLYEKLGRRLFWQLILCVIVWVFVWFWLQIVERFWLDIPNKFTLALIAGLTEFLPYIWPILWGIPWVLVASLAFWRQWFIVTIIMYWVVQQLENNVLVPLIMSQTLWVSPLLIFVCMLVSWLLLWLLWVIIAVPIALIINIFYKEYTSRYKQ